MKKSVLISGASGSGKSSVVGELTKMGYEAYDLEAIEGLFVILDKETRQPVSHHDDQDIKKIQKIDWICDEQKLREIIASQKNEVAFYSGIPSNLEAILPLFSSVIVLIAHEENTRQRLLARTTSDFGKAPEVRDWILNGKQGLEHWLQEKGAIVVDANQDLNSVAKEIVERTSTS